MMENVSLRIPSQWAGRVDSGQMQLWLANYLQSPCSLPPDPGPGEHQLSISLPPRAVKYLAETLGESASESLRRIAALNLRSPYPVAIGESSFSAQYDAGMAGGASIEAPSSAQAPAIKPRAEFWDLQMKIMVWAVVGAAVLFWFLVKFGKREPIQSSAPRAEFASWTPVGS